MTQEITEKLTRILAKLVTLEGMLQAVCDGAYGYNGEQTAERRIMYLGSSVEVALAYLSAQDEELDKLLLMGP